MCVVVQLVPRCPCQSPDHPDRQWVRLGLPKDLRTPTQPAESLTLPPVLHVSPMNSACNFGTHFPAWPNTGYPKTDSPPDRQTDRQTDIPYSTSDVPGLLESCFHSEPASRLQDLSLRF